MESETRLVCLLVLLLVYELGEISAATRCYECGTMFTPYCDDPLFLKSSMTYEPTLCTSLHQDDVFASQVIRYFITYMTDVTEEMEGTLDVEATSPDLPKEEKKETKNAEEKKETKNAEKKDIPKAERSATISWLDRIAPAFHISQRSKRQIVNSLPGNWSLRQDKKEKPKKEKPPPAEEPVEPEKVQDASELEPDAYKCYKLVFANMRDELEEFRGCVLPKLFDVCDLLINFNKKSKERVVFCELCNSDVVDKDHPPCNEASTLDSSRELLTFIVALTWLFIALLLHCTV